ncbi:cytochrome c-type biogenesis protein CcmH [Maricurvus nonylphenolicus]|uniref:cytochrome c-type biogenesis protein n=1 Tax=Maricurvus nonylphenolicus TaxID=1008307 RepID=UPI0036F3C2EF
MLGTNLLAKWCAAVLLWGLASAAWSVVDVFEFNSDVDRERYLELIEEMRCPKCQNQNLAGSDSPIAQDLRREIHRMLDEGKSDQEIVDFMVARYGEYVLYRPRVQRSTWILWGLPLGLVTFGVILLLLIGRKRKEQLAPSGLSSADAERLQALKQEAEKRAKNDSNQS